MTDNVMPLPMNCKCGAAARVRYKIPVTWVECKKKCGMQTGFFTDKFEQRDSESEKNAILEWNRMVSRDG